MNEYVNECDHCGNTYDSDREGHTHDEECECQYCDTNHDDYDEYNARPIAEFVADHGSLNFCCQECENSFIQERS